MKNITKIGVGVFQLEGKTCYDAIKIALEAGYRHIDTAQIYGNEKEVGQAIVDSKIPREEIFITTKIWMENLGKDKFISSLRESLEKLQTDYVDLLLIHWPLKDNSIPMEEYLGELKKAKDLGLTRNIGVSNFTLAQLKQAISILGTQEIFTNQIEIHPYLQNSALVDFCQSHGILVSAYMPLAKGEVIKDPILQTIAEKYQISTAAVALAWLLHKNIVTFPSSTSKEHSVANLEALNLQLRKEDIEQINQINKNERIVNPDFAPNWD